MTDSRPAGLRPNPIDGVNAELAERAGRGDPLHEIWWVAATRAREALGGAVGLVTPLPPGSPDLQAEALVVTEDAVAWLDLPLWDRLSEACKGANQETTSGAITALIDADHTGDLPPSARVEKLAIVVAPILIEDHRRVVLAVVRSVDAGRFGADDTNRLATLAGATSVAAGIAQARRSLNRTSWAHPAASSALRSECRRGPRLGSGWPRRRHR